MEAIGKLSKEYLEREYHQAILDFKGAINEDARWQALPAQGFPQK